ncbi:MAG: nucleotide sugar dehydrogenase [Erythrobacter sp.]
MKIAIFGLGYVGCTAAGCIASQGHQVVGVDVNSTKIDTLNAGLSPVHEPGLADLIAQGNTAGLIRATSDVSAALDGADMAMVCVGTPSGPDGAHDMSHVIDVTRSIAENLPEDRTTPLTLVYRSTMRPGSCENIVVPVLVARLGARTHQAVELVYNPEFLREASAIADYFNPPKIVTGTVDSAPSERMEQLYSDMDAPRFHVGWSEAEMTKFVDNSWHATKVAFANEIGRVCEQLGVNAEQVHAMFIADTKLNISAHYLRPGGAFGGSCLPKDVRALQNIASDIGAQTHLVDALIRSNEAHKHHQFQRASKGLENGAKVLVVGLAFKPDTDDLRESPAVDLVRKLLDAGFAVDVYDPQVEPDNLVGQNLGYARSILPGMEGLLVGRGEAQSGGYARVVATNRLIDSLDIDPANIIDLSVIE